MNYSLARELKDAGWPQKIQTGARFVTPTGIHWFCENQSTKNLYTEDCAVDPTLEELIKECSSEFVCVRNWQMEQFRYNGACEATDTPFIAESTRIESGDEGTTSWVSARGATPTEAVARLYIALKKKDGPPKEVI